MHVRHLNATVLNLAFKRTACSQHVYCMCESSFLYFRDMSTQKDAHLQAATRVTSSAWTLNFLFANTSRPALGNIQ